MKINIRIRYNFRPSNLRWAVINGVIVGVAIGFGIQSYREGDWFGVGLFGFYALGNIAMDYGLFKIHLPWR